MLPSPYLPLSGFGSELFGINNYSKHCFLLTFTLMDSDLLFLFADPWQVFYPDLTHPFFFGSDWFQTGSVSRIQFTIPDPKHCYNIVLAFKMLLTPRYLCFHKLLRSRKTVESVSEPRVYTIHISIH